MKNSLTDDATNSFGARWAQAMIRHRWLVIVLSLAMVGIMASGVTKLVMLTDYRAFFSPENPELTAFEDFQATYTKVDNVFFLIRPEDGNVFTSQTLAAVEELTERGWQIPHASRVDSITNFQHTYAVGDDLIVEDLIEKASTLTADYIEERKAILLAEPLTRNLLVTEDSRATAVNVTIRLPGLDLGELPATFAGAREARDAIEAQYPGLDIRVSGVAALNQTFATEPAKVMAKLLPLMFLVIFVLSVFFLKSILATAAMLLVVTLSAMAAMGLSGYLGLGISPVSIAAPIVILTLAVADSVHIVTALRDAVARGMEYSAALVDAIRTNIAPVSVTSITTAIGFLALNFSDAPPFRALGNMSAIGIVVAWILSLTLFPALASLLRLKIEARESDTRLMTRYADWVIANSRIALAVAVAISVGLIAAIPRLEVNDLFVEYFDTRVEFRRDTDVIKEYFGPLPLEYSIPATESGAVADPKYLRTIDEFVSFARKLPRVVHVFSISDIMKRLNKNMHADDSAYYSIPRDRELAAQYLLLYELSLPYGLDLNDRINIDKSEMRITFAMEPMTTRETKAMLAAVDEWFEENAPNIEPAAAGPQVMFTFIADRNIDSMITGTVIAVFAISAILVLALRSFGLGLLSLVPNALPILSAFGVWAIINGEIGFSVAVVGSLSLGIVVDDTVHFLMKFNRARNERGMSVESAIRYAFESVGAAIAANTVILTCGFLVLTQSTFKPIVDMGLLTSISIVLALVLDFLLLPPLLLWFLRNSRTTERSGEGLNHA